MNFKRCLTIILTVCMMVLLNITSFAQDVATEPYNQWDGMRLPEKYVTASSGAVVDVCLGNHRISVSANGSFVPIYFDGKNIDKTGSGMSTSSVSIKVRDWMTVGDHTLRVGGSYGDPLQWSCTVRVHKHEKEGYKCKWCGTMLGAYTFPTYAYDNQNDSIKTVIRQWGIGPGDYWHNARDGHKYIYEWGSGKISSSDGEKYGSKYMPSVVKCGTKMARRHTDWNGDVYYTFNNYIGKNGKITTYPIWSAQLTSMNGSPNGYAHNYYDVSTSPIFVEHWYRNWSHNSTHHWKTCACGNAGSKSPHSSSTWRYDANNHWKICDTCGAQFAIGKHTLNSNGVCTGCGGKFHTHSYDKLVSTVKPPTCSQQGVGNFGCNCGQGGTVQKPLPVNPNNHTYGTPYVTKQPTCTETGQKRKECTGCGHIADSTIPALGHDFQWKWYPNNGVENAYKQLTCTRCGVTQGNPVWTTYTVTYQTVDKDNNIVMQTKTATKKRGDIVNGNDIGQEDITYQGVPYAYSSCDKGVCVKGSTTVKRYYRKTQYVIVYNSNGGTGQMGTQTIKYDQSANLLPNKFKKVGYDFKGWSKNKTGTTMYTDGQSVTNVISRTESGNTVTLYAIWEGSKYRVKFKDTNGHQVEYKIVTFDKPYGTLPNPVDGNFRLAQWVYRIYNTATDITEIPIDSTTIVTIPNDHELYGKWKEKAWDVQFLSPSKSQVVTVLHKRQVQEPFTPNEVGMNFLRWSETPNGETPFDFSTPIVEDKKLYAVFEAATYTITMEGTGHVDRIYPCEIGNLPNGVQTGKTFEGWYYDATLTQKVNATDQMPPRDISVYPKFSAGEYKLTLKGRSENWALKYGQEIPQLPTPTEEGKEFRGWMYQSIFYKGGDVFEWDHNVELEPIWDIKQVIVYYPDGTAKPKDYGDTVGNLPTPPTVTGKDFIGFKDQEGNWVTESTVVKKDMIIEYVYESASITITLKDGDWEQMKNVESGTTVIDLPQRSKDGYSFKGWSTSPNGAVTRGPFYFDTTLHAVYAEGEQDIYFTDLNLTIRRKTGQQLGTLPTFSKEGFRFLGWEHGGVMVGPTTTTPVGGLVLNARLEPINTGATETVVIRYWSDGVRINTEDLPVGEILWDPGAPPMTSADARVFQYWSDRPDGDRYDFGHMVNADVDLYAVWK